MYEDIYLHAVNIIGKHFVNSALWEGDKCYWNEIPAFPSEDKNTSGLSQELFQGNAGIALFLIELYSLTNDRDYIRTAEAAIRSVVLKDPKIFRPGNNFFHGVLGLAYTCSRFNIVTGSDIFEEDIHRIIEITRRSKKSEHRLSFFEGCAGSIPVLLNLAYCNKNTAAVSMAEDTAAYIIDKAFTEPLGWSWGNRNIISKRNLCGIAYGASGMGSSLLELFAYTGKIEYLYAAEQSFIYERQFYSQQYHNWPDFRLLSLRGTTSTHLPDNLSDTLKNTGLNKSLMLNNNSLAFGSAGITISRLRAYEITRDPVFEKEAINALQSTIESLNISKKDYSIYEGELGKFEAILSAWRVFKKREYLELSEEFLLQAIETINLQHLVSGGKFEEPIKQGLFTGIAGLGYSLLRFLSDQVPSLLLPEIKQKKVSISSDNKNYRALQRKYIGSYFGKTIDVINKLPVRSNPDLNIDFKVGRTISDIQIAYHRLMDYIEMAGGESKNIIMDVFQIEEAAYRMQLENSDYSSEFVEKIKRDNVSQRIDDECYLHLPGESTIIETRNDIESILENFGTTVNPELFEKGNRWFLYSKDNRINIYPVTEFTAMILEKLKTPKVFAELLFEIMTQDNIHETDSKIFSKILREQVRALYAEGMINKYYDLDETLVTEGGIEISSSEKSESQKSMATLNNILLNAVKVEALSDETSRRLAIDSLVDELDLLLGILKIREQYLPKIKEYYSNRSELYFWELIDQLNDRFILTEVGS